MKKKHALGWRLAGLLVCACLVASESHVKPCLTAFRREPARYLARLDGK